MTQQQSGTRAERMATGFIVFGAMMMILVGSFQVLMGIAGIFRDEFYLSTPNYVFAFDATAWGWIHLVLGLVVIAVGFGILAGQTWGRVGGVVLAVCSALSNFVFIPFYPFWSILIIVLNVFVIWALTAHGRDFELEAKP
ncbi:DUF7144 family membrane protein [Nocardioides sp. GXQ0305]|uniref:DUF7144 family membrane protein n=1 Tax=Nocardioides sp. GXQ0305 TaxID=3423912 RepID=UPI003D7DB431